MKKGFIVVLVLVGLIVVFFVPFNRQITVRVNASFFKVYKQLLVARNWANWQPELKRDFESDSTKVTFITKPDGYSVNTPSTNINVRESASNFVIQQQGISGDRTYSYTVAPDKHSNKSLIAVVLKTNVIGFITGLISNNPFGKTDIYQFKQYLETDSLFYGFNIYKVRVPGANLLEVHKVVPLANQYAAADSEYADLTNFIVKRQLKKAQPVIAQFIPKGPDSVQVNVGFYIDKQITATGHVTYVKMPKSGNLIVIDYKGKFNERYKAYAALKRYFTDHTFQSAILPFETYFNDKLPRSDTGRVNIRINFSSFE